MRQRFTLKLANGTAHAVIYSTDRGEYGLVLENDAGLPIGKGVTLSNRQASRLAKELEGCKPVWRASLIWATLGYTLKRQKAVALCICHPGELPVQGSVRAGRSFW